MQKDKDQPSHSHHRNPNSNIIDRERRSMGEFFAVNGKNSGTTAVKVIMH